MEYLSVSSAQRIVLDSVITLGSETIRLEHSLGRVLAQHISANRDLPPYDVSAMDGYAVRSADLASGAVNLKIIEDIKAGDIPTMTVQAGQCSRIMTGAPVPQGADAVIRVEDTEIQPDECVRFAKAAPVGHDIRLRGESMRNGDVVLAAGTSITPGVAGVLATVKCAEFQVYRRPRVAILSTGNELEAMDEPIDPNKIPDANGYALMAQVQALGIEPVLLGIARDDPVELERHLRQGLDYDVLLVSGGTSVGVHDYVRPTVEKLGVQMKFWRVSMKPGHPLAFGLLVRPNNTQAAVFGLPGNPVSSMVCFEEFVLLALRAMMGQSQLHRRTVSARLAHAIKIKPGRTEFVRVVLSRDADGYIATSTGTQSSGALLSMARADGLLIAPSDSTGLAAGEIVTVQFLDGAAFQNQADYRE